MDRRKFLRTSSAAATLALSSDFTEFPGLSIEGGKYQLPQLLWFRKVTRWGQTNITEKDPRHYDINWWRTQWRRTETRGVIINAGGIVAYYPSRVPLHRQARYLDGRDLFGELCRAAHEEDMAVFARMDSNRAGEEFYQAHPDWFAVDAEGNPYKAGDLYITCINGPYYNDHIPAILAEIARLYKPEGFTDNSWSGLGRNSICHCGNCRSSFASSTGFDIPLKADWDDQGYREWIMWNYRRRIEIWDLNNRVTKEAGGPDCIWSGMNSGSLAWQAESFRDYKQICERAEIIMLDSQARSDSGGFQQNSWTGKLIHGLLGWDKLVPESMAMYQAGRPTFRMSAKPACEARMWMMEGIAGGIQPWWHYVGASHEDRRMYKTPTPVMKWHEVNEQFLTDRKPLASVGLVWSQRNIDFYGRDEAETVTELPWMGMTQALIRDRIPFLPVNADHIERDAAGLSLIILPNLGVLTEDQANAVRKFSNAGGGVLATGETGLYNEWGESRSDYILADLFGVHLEKNRLAGDRDELLKDISSTSHTYLRLNPELRKNIDGPSDADAPEITGVRHPVLKGFGETDIISFGGILRPVLTDQGSEILMTYIPPFPIYPPETAWMRVPKTDIPGLIINNKTGRGRVAFLTADIDRQFGKYNLPDHGNLLTNIVRWAAEENIPLRIKCPGMLDCNIYRKNDSLILHLVNLTSTATWRQPLDEYIPVGPVTVELRIPEDLRPGKVVSIVSGCKIKPSFGNGWCRFEVGTITDHEVMVIS